MTDRQARILAILTVAVTGLLVAALAVWRASRPARLSVELDRERYPISGIDLSAHNGVPDFDSIAADSIEFVYLKASEGGDYRDPSFIRNYAAATGAGLTVGAYHFFRFDTDGVRQARNMLDAVKGCRLDLPLAIDVEENGNPAQVPTGTIIDRLEAMVAYLRVFGREVIIYTNKNGEARFLRDSFGRTYNETPELWICSFTDPPLPRRKWLLWQHSHTGRVRGVKGPVDLNTFNGDSAAWRAWLSRVQP